MNIVLASCHNFYYPNMLQNNLKYPSKKWSIYIVVIRKMLDCLSGKSTGGVPGGRV